MRAVPGGESAPEPEEVLQKRLRYVPFRQDRFVKRKCQKLMPFAAVLATMTGRDASGEWVKFGMTVQNIFKKTKESRIRRGNTEFWVRQADLACKCPKIKTNK